MLTFLKFDFEEFVVDVFKCNKCNRLFSIDLNFGKFLKLVLFILIIC